MLRVLVKGNSDNELKINGEGEIAVVIHQNPPVDEEVLALPFRQYFTDNGLSTGSNAMNVDGSSANVSFYITANPEYDIYIKYITVEIGDGGTPSLNKFGALSALSN